jgi:hypothetical protein
MGSANAVGFSGSGLGDSEEVAAGKSTLRDRLLLDWASGFRTPRRRPL